MTERQLFEFVKKMLRDLKMSEYKFSKYDALMQRAIKFGTRPVYINSTPIGIWAFYLDDQEIRWEEREMPRTTDFSNNEKISKKVGYLNINNGKKIK